MEQEQFRLVRGFADRERAEVYRAYLEKIYDGERRLNLHVLEQVGKHAYAVMCRKYVGLSERKTMDLAFDVLYGILRG